MYSPVDLTHVPPHKPRPLQNVIFLFIIAGDSVHGGNDRIGTPALPSHYPSHKLAPYQNQVPGAIIPGAKKQNNRTTWYSHHSSAFRRFNPINLFATSESDGGELLMIRIQGAGTYTCGTNL